MRQQKLAKAVEHFQIRVTIGNDLAQEGIKLHVAAEFVPKLLFLIVLFQSLEAIHGGLKMLLHLCMIGRTLFFFWLVEDLGERFDLATMINLLVIQLMLEPFKLRWIRGSLQAGPIVIGFESA